MRDALSHGGMVFAPEDIRLGLLRNEMKLWLASDETGPVACCVTRIEKFPRSTVCAILILSGDNMAEWFKFLPDIEDWGRSKGADCAQCVGRKGWTRILAGPGYEPMATIYRKAL